MSPDKGWRSEPVEDEKEVDLRVGGGDTSEGSTIGWGVCWRFRGT